MSKQVLWIASLNIDLYLYKFEIIDCVTCEHYDIIMSVCKRFQLSFQHLGIQERCTDDWKGDLNSMGNNEWRYIIINRYILNLNPQVVLQNTKDTNSRKGMWKWCYYELMVIIWAWGKCKWRCTRCHAYRGMFFMGGGALVIMCWF